MYDGGHDTVQCTTVHCGDKTICTAKDTTPYNVRQFTVETTLSVRRRTRHRTMYDSSLWRQHYLYGKGHDTVQCTTVHCGDNSVCTAKDTTPYNVRQFTVETTLSVRQRTRHRTMYDSSLWRQLCLYGEGHDTVQCTTVHCGDNTVCTAKDTTPYNVRQFTVETTLYVRRRTRHRTMYDSSLWRQYCLYGEGHDTVQCMTVHSGDNTVCTTEDTTPYNVGPTTVHCGNNTFRTVMTSTVMNISNIYFLRNITL